MFGFRRKTNNHTDSVVGALLEISAEIVHDTSIGLKEWIKEDWVNEVLPMRWAHFSLH